MPTRRTTTRRKRKTTGSGLTRERIKKAAIGVAAALPVLIASAVAAKHGYAAANHHLGASVGDQVFNKIPHNLAVSYAKRNH